MKDGMREGRGYMYFGDDSYGFLFESWWCKNIPLYGRRIDYEMHVYIGQFNEEFEAHGSGEHEYASGNTYEGDHRSN
jgi:hypothetical protein